MPWQLIDFPVRRQASAPCVAAPGSGGQAALFGSVQIAFPPVPVDQLWRVEGIVVMCQNPSGVRAAAACYDLPVPATNIVPPGQIPCAATRNGNFDVSDQGSPITIPGGGLLTIVFGPVDIGVQALARVQYALYAGTPSKATPVAGAGPSSPIPVSI